jgi:hypothetical protein
MVQLLAVWQYVLRLRHMDEQNAGEKPETQPITGRKKPTPETGEAGGRLRTEEG